MKSILRLALDKGSDIWDFDFINSVLQLYKEVPVATQYEEVCKAWPPERASEKWLLEWKREVSHKKLLWKFAIKGCLTAEQEVQQIDLSEKDTFALDVCKTVCAYWNSQFLLQSYVRN